MSHGISWKLLCIFSFWDTECDYRLQRSPETTADEHHIAVTTKLTKRTVVYKLLHWIKLAFFLYMIVAYLRQGVDLVHRLTMASNNLTSILGYFRWRVIQLASISIVLFSIFKRKRFHEMCSLRYVLAESVQRICSKAAWLQLRRKNRRFEYRLLAVTAIGYVVCYTGIRLSVTSTPFYPLDIWPLPVNVTFPNWSSEVFYSLPSQTITFLAYLITNVYCVHLFFGIYNTECLCCHVENSEKADIEHLREFISVVVKYFEAVHNQFSGLITIQICSETVTALCYISGLSIESEFADHALIEDKWFVGCATMLMIIWNMVFVFGTRMFLAIKFQDSVHRLLEAIKKITRSRTVECVGLPSATFREKKLELMDLKLDLLAVSQTPVTFTAMGFFNLDRSFVVAVLGFLVTYAVVVNQVLKNNRR